MLPLSRVDHISFATPSIDASLAWFEAVFGARLVERRALDDEGFTFATLELPNAQIHFELIEPLGDDSFVARFLEARGPGVHHITLDVASVDDAAAHLRTHGIEPWGGVRGDGEWRETFIHPRDAGGVLFQLVKHT